MVPSWKAGEYGSLFQSGRRTCRVLLCHTVYFLLRCETQRYGRQRPCFFPSDVERVLVSICVSVSQHLVLCFHVHMPVCVLGCVSKCVSAACSRCDRWNAAHAQINRPTLLKSGLCLLSNSVSLSAPHSLCHSLYFAALSLNHGHVGIQRELCRIIAVP